jgi:hypothetical protein
MSITYPTTQSYRDGTNTAASSAIAKAQDANNAQTILNNAVGGRKRKQVKYGGTVAVGIIGTDPKTSETQVKMAEQQLLQQENSKLDKIGGTKVNTRKDDKNNCSCFGKSKKKKMKSRKRKTHRKRKSHRK